MTRARDLAKFNLDGQAVTINESSADLDFRVESNGNANMLFVDGGNDTVNIGSADQGAVRLGQNLNMVVTGDTFGGIALTTYSTTDSRRSLLDFNKSGQATIGSHGVVADDEILGSIMFRGDDGDEFVDGAEIRASVDGTPGGNDMPTRLTFSTTADGANSVTERMRIDAAGDVGIGTSDPVAPLHVVGGGLFVNTLTANTSSAFHFSNTVSGGAYRVRFDANSNTVGSIGVTTSGTAFNTSSDYRLKENVVTDWDATSRLKQLKPSRFNFKEDADTTVDGFLAHEVSSIVPEAISGTKDETRTVTKGVFNSSGNPIAEGIKEEDWKAGKLATKDAEDNDVAAIYPSDSTWSASKDVPVYQGIDQSKLVPLLVKTIQELETRIKTLEDA